MRWDSAEFRDWMRQPTVWAILVVGAVLSLFAWRILSLEVENAARASFESAAAEARSAIQTRLRGYSVALRGLQGLFHSAGEVDAEAFRRYVDALGPGQVRSLSYARFIVLSEKAEYEKRARPIRPAGARAEYVVLHLVEPRAPNASGLGLDLLGDPARRAPIEQARDTGALVASPPFTLVSAPEAGAAVSLRLPVYRRGAALDSFDARRRAFAGVVSATFLISDLVEDVVARHSAAALRLVVRDGAAVLHNPAGGARPAEPFEAQATLNVGERAWQLEFTAPRQRFRTAGDVAMPWLALVGGLLITGLLSGLVGSLATSTRRARRIAAEMTEGLRASQSELAESQRRLLMEHAVTRVLAEADSVSSGLQGMLRSICEAEGWDCGRYYVHDVRAGLLRFSEYWCIDQDEVRNFVERTRDMVFAPGDGLAGKAWQAGEPIWTPDLSSDTRGLRRYTSAFGIRGAFVFPVQSGGTTLGVAAFASRVVREPDGRLLEAVRVIGSQVGQFLIRKQAEEALRFVATHDSLTRLPNRVMFGQRLEHALSQAQRHARRLAVLFIDLDRFKVINDTLGHDAGDAILRDVARRLVDNLRASDTVARLGGDEFVVLLEEIADPMFVGAVAQKLIGVLSQPFTLAGRDYQVTASIGAATYPEDGGDVQELLKNADTAMYRAKEQGRNAFRAYSGVPA